MYTMTCKNFLKQISEFEIFKKVFEGKQAGIAQLLKWFHDTQHKDIQPSDTQLEGLIDDSQLTYTTVSLTTLYHYAECHYAECCYGECRGAVKTLHF
jgi:hypothetical protein